jgi:hypothetical protein
VIACQAFQSRLPEISKDQEFIFSAAFVEAAIRHVGSFTAIGPHFATTIVEYMVTVRFFISFDALFLFVFIFHGRSPVHFYIN